MTRCRCSTNAKFARTLENVRCEEEGFLEELAMNPTKRDLFYILDALRETR